MAAGSEPARGARAADRLRRAAAPVTPGSPHRSRADSHSVDERADLRPRAELAPPLRPGSQARPVDTVASIDRSRSLAASLLIEPMAEDVQCCACALPACRGNCAHEGCCTGIAETFEMLIISSPPARTWARAGKSALVSHWEVLHAI